jgi:PAS domain S-box-containing protein
VCETHGSGKATLVASVKGRIALAERQTIVPVFSSLQQRPGWVRYGAAFILVAIAGGCNYLMPPVYGESHYFFFSAAILASALFGGLGPGLMATAVSALVSAYLFIAPFYSFRIEAPEAARRLAVFVVEGAIISSVGNVIRDNRTLELVSPWRRYASAVALVAGAAVFKLLLFPTLERQVPFTFFYSAVVTTSWVAGAAPGLCATLLAMVSSYYLFLRYGAGTPGNPALMLFALESTGLCLLTALFRQRLVETEANLGRVFEDSPTGILIVEAGGRILKANPAFRQILRFEKARFEGHSLTDVVHSDCYERVRTFLDRLIQQEGVGVVEEVCLVQDTTMAWANLRGSWIRQNASGVETCLIMVEDITERRKIEETLRETQLRLERGQRIEAIGMFAGGIAHDFNNLLAVIFGGCERQLIQKNLPPGARGCIEEILETAKTAAELTRQLLVFARRQPGRAQVIAVNGLVSESAALLRRLLGARIELKTELAANAGRVRADPGQLQQILMNLAVNARDAMPSGGRLTIQTSRTGVAAPETVKAPLPARPYVTLQVADTGHGMDDVTRARIFEPLFSTKDLEKGTGLGLATVHNIVSKLGGYIRVESSPGNGARFSIHLPSVDPGEESSPVLKQSGRIGSA